MRDALSYCWHDPRLRGALLVVAVIDVFGQNFRVTLPLLASEHGEGADMYGNLMAAIGGGAIVGSFVGAAFTSREVSALVAAARLHGR